MFVVCPERVNPLINVRSVTPTAAECKQLFLLAETLVSDFLLQHTRVQCEANIVNMTLPC